MSSCKNKDDEVLRKVKISQTMKKYWLSNSDKVKKHKKKIIKNSNKGRWKKGLIPWNKNGHLTEENKKKVSLGVKRYIEKNGYSFLDSLPHRTLREAMQKVNLYEGFQTEKLYECDKFSLNIDELNDEKKIAIFIDGDFWHGHKRMFPNIQMIHPCSKKTIKQIHIKDRNISNYLKSKGYKVLRFWECEIKGSLDKCLKTISTTINMVQAM